MRLDEVAPIVILGAGPAGALMATYLGQQGHRVDVYESRQDMRLVDIDAGRSINLALATRGIVPLIEIGIMDKVADILIPMRGRAIHAQEGPDPEPVLVQPYGSAEHEVIHSVARSDLNGLLLDAAEATGNVTFHFEQRCRELDVGARMLRFEDRDGEASAEYYGLLIGADGAGSIVRESMMAAGADTSVSIEPLDHDYKELTLAPGVDGEFQLDPNALHIWPKGQYMLIALANPDKDFTVTLFMPAEPVPGSEDSSSFEGLRTPDDVDAFFAEKFPDFAALVPDIAEQFFANPTGKLATVRTSGWSHRSSAVLLGDAAHAIVPFHGQGMNAAMESCRVLNNCLAANPDDIEAGFKEFEATRKSDVDAIADLALSNYVEMRFSVVDPDYLIKRELALELQRRWPDRIAPRYGMVMFSIIPYADVLRRAEQQAAVLDELCQGCATLGDIDFERAEELVLQLDELPTNCGEPSWT